MGVNFKEGLKNYNRTMMIRDKVSAEVTKLLRAKSSPYKYCLHLKLSASDTFFCIFH